MCGYNVPEREREKSIMRDIECGAEHKEELSAFNYPLAILT